VGPVIRVLLVIDGLQFGGAENVLVTFAAYARQAGVAPRVAVLAPPTGGRDRWLPAVRAAGLDPRFLGIERLAQPDGVARVAAAIRASGCDVVHAHLEDSATLVPVAAALARRPAVCTLHHVPEADLDRRTALRERLAVRLASRTRGLIFVSEASRRGFADRYGADPRTWTVIPNGIDVERFAPGGPPSPLRAELGLPPDAPVVTVVGHMRYGKGHDVAVEAWPRVLDEFPDARLLLVGDGPNLAGLRRRTGELGITGRVVFAGPRGDMPGVLHASDLVLLPTRIEALPTVLLEAAACGVPAVATRVGGVPEVVDDGVTGLLFPAPEPGHASEAVRNALRLRRDDPTAFATMGKAARARATSEFDARVWTGRLATAYRTAIAGHSLGEAR